MGPDLPVQNITWLEAAKYCNRLSERDGYTPVYRLEVDGVPLPITSVIWNREADGYRLLTEAEWEYACRAGTTTAFPSGGLVSPTCSPLDPNLDRLGWYCGNATSPQPVETTGPNPWGLYDMHGNVREWCWDKYAAYRRGPLIDPVHEGGHDRVLRGGNWHSGAHLCRSASRASLSALEQNWGVGFRVARTARDEDDAHGDAPLR
jgi:formylglycine-generating enzyme required for sulfatase activity